MTITLDAIKTEHSKVAEMIAAYERQSASTQYRFSAVNLTLAPGERYAGLILGEAGEPDHHVILLAGEVEDVTWENAGNWAKDAGGSLPTRREQSLLFANLKGEFQSSWYWSSEQHESESGWAWFQSFFYGAQYGTRKLGEIRARAVRRLII